MRRELENIDASMWGGEQPQADTTDRATKHTARPTRGDEGSYPHPEDIRTPNTQSSAPVRVKENLTRVAIGYGNSPATQANDRLSTLL